VQVIREYEAAYAVVHSAVIHHNLRTLTDLDELNRFQKQTEFHPLRYGLKCVRHLMKISSYEQ
jgi:hypothetical protein